MAVPKKRKSKGRSGAHRAASWKIAMPSHSLCPRCSEAKLPHRVCGACGWYNGRVAIEV